MATTYEHLIQGRVFTEVAEQCDFTGQLYAIGKEKPEIAKMKCRSVSTVNNQIQTLFEVLGVRNGRELAIEYAKRVFVLAILIAFSCNLNYQSRRQRNSGNYRCQYLCRIRTKSHGEILTIIPV